MKQSESPFKWLGRQMARRIPLWQVLIVAVLILLGYVMFSDRLGISSSSVVVRPTAAIRVTPSANPTRSTSGTTLATGSGRGEEAGDDFTVPRGCDRQMLIYSGNQIDKDIDVSWVGFRARDTQGDMAEHINPADLLNAEDGSGAWALSPGVYSIEAQSFNAAWRYTLKCR